MDQYGHLLDAGPSDASDMNQPTLVPVDRAGLSTVDQRKLRGIGNADDIVDGDAEGLGEDPYGRRTTQRGAARSDRYLDHEFEQQLGGGFSPAVRGTDNYYGGENFRLRQPATVLHSCCIPQPIGFERLRWY